MRKKSVAIRPQPNRSTKRPLRLSKESVRTLTKDDLSQAASGCPWGSITGGTLDQDPGI
jgi:hypothetical protein